MAYKRKAAATIVAAAFSPAKKNRPWLRDVKRSTPEEARAWVERITDMLEHDEQPKRVSRDVHLFRFHYSKLFACYRRTSSGELQWTPRFENESDAQDAAHDGRWGKLP